MILINQLSEYINSTITFHEWLINAHSDSLKAIKIRDKMMAQSRKTITVLVNFGMNYAKMDHNLSTAIELLPAVRKKVLDQHLWLLKPLFRIKITQQRAESTIKAHNSTDARIHTMEKDSTVARRKVNYIK